jgi:membrane protein DedA with SNARE-associated domain
MPAPERRRNGRILALVLQTAEPVLRHVHHMTVLERIWKYTALGVSSIVFEEANPILGGIAARHGRAEMLGVVIAVALGTWAFSIALYYIGLWRIDWVHARWPHKRQLLDSALALVQRHPWRASLAVRFAYGLRLPLPIACGAARVPLGLYGLASGISCWVWAVAFAYLGLAFGRAALRVLVFTHRLDVRLGFVVLLLLIVLLFVTRRRLVAERGAERIASEPPTPVLTTDE